MRLLPFFLLLAACAPIRSEVLTFHDDWTGASTFTVNEREVFRDRDGLLTVRPVIVQNPQGRAFGVLTDVRRRDANGPQVERVTTDRNTPLAYRQLDRLYTHCIDGCQRAETGVIYLSEATFRLAAQQGLPLRVWGRRGRYHGTVPAEAFALALTGIADGQ